MINKNIQENFSKMGSCQYLPIKLQHLLMKMEAAKKVGFEKGLTFEFSHFMSPNSEYGAARNLHKLYCKFMDINY